MCGVGSEWEGRRTDGAFCSSHLHVRGARGGVDDVVGDVGGDQRLHLRRESNHNSDQSTYRQLYDRARVWPRGSGERGGGKGPEAHVGVDRVRLLL